MTDASYQKAHEEAVSFLKSYSIWIPTPPPTTSTPNLLDILEALAEA